ncbi:response regulator transcription factor [Ancylobacter vacuolatus]|uniref:DNA-binding response OmpR family regulator n=1 Tax=Ancylobacter vacuolatus TaxID=223389 RepID=A0ABU0DMJ2_9HYPH|nr:response regulator transcription factor [Ancylobacter vacuolatus]MDQ0349632.1 DNA-binding response OmpR family regulator [Ancylobacter vacuolatus]
MKILLLEDNPSMREIVADHLTRSGFVVDAVRTGNEALAAVATVPYDAMVLDLGLPDIDGMDVLRQVRARTGDRLPALIVTARDSLQSRLSGLNSGADDYIVKPFELVELEARLRVVLRRPGQRGSVRYACGRLSFDSMSRQALVDDIPIELARRELALLEELLRAAGRVVVKDALEDRLYSIEQEVSSNAIEAAVSRLRKKLAAAKAGVTITTMRGIGYCMALGGDDEG